MNANDKILPVMNESSEEVTASDSRCKKKKNTRALKMPDGGFASVCSVEEFISEQRGKALKFKENFRLFLLFLSSICQKLLWPPNTSRKIKCQCP